MYVHPATLIVNTDEAPGVELTTRLLELGYGVQRLEALPPEGWDGQLPTQAPELYWVDLADPCLTQPQQAFIEQYFGGCCLWVGPEVALPLSGTWQCVVPPIDMAHLVAILERFRASVAQQQVYTFERGLLENTQEGVIRCQLLPSPHEECPVWRILEANAAFFRLLACEQQDIIGRDLRQLIPPAVLVQCEEKLEGLFTSMRKGIIFFHEQSNRYLGIRCFRHQRGERGVIFWDETNRITAESDLQRFFELSVDLMCLANAQGRFTRVSPSFCELLGYTEKQLLSCPFFEFVHPDDLKATEQELANIVQGARTLDFENRYRKRDGSYVWLAWRSTKLTEDGKIFATARDVTERRKHLEALRIRDRAFSAISLGIIIVDARAPDMPVVYCNQGFEEITGYRARDVLGKNCRFLQGTDRNQPGVMEMRRALQEHRSCKVVVRNYRKNGSMFRNEMTLSPVWDREQDQQPSHYIGILSDVTSLKELEENLEDKVLHRTAELNRLNKKLSYEVEERKAVEQKVLNLNKRLERRALHLEETNKELSLFMHIASHDLGGPMRQLTGYPMLLERYYGDLLDERGREFLKHIKTSAERMTEMLEGLRMMSRQTRGELNFVQIDLGKMAWKIVQAFKSEAEVSDKGAAPPQEGQAPLAHRRLSFACDENLTAIADPRLMRVVLNNLLENAWKYTAHEAIARISFFKIKENGETVFAISDNGIGFDMAKADQLFGIFRRLHEEEEFQGSGIGLASVKRIIHRHGGKIWAESEPGRGATFYFTLS